MLTDNFMITMLVRPTVSAAANDVSIIVAHLRPTIEGCPHIRTLLYSNPYLVSRNAGGRGNKSSHDLSKQENDYYHRESKPLFFERSHSPE